MMNRPQGLEARFYTDADVFAAEMDAIFARTWIMVGHESQVAEPGQLITARVGDEDVIVANDNGISVNVPSSAAMIGNFALMM